MCQDGPTDMATPGLQHINEKLAGAIVARRPDTRIRATPHEVRDILRRPHYPSLPSGIAAVVQLGVDVKQSWAETISWCGGLDDHRDAVQ